MGQCSQIEPDFVSDGCSQENHENKNRLLKEKNETYLLTGSPTYNTVTMSNF